MSVLIWYTTTGQFPEKKNSISNVAQEADLKIFCQGRTLITDTNFLWVDDKKLGSTKQEK